MSYQIEQHLNNVGNSFLPQGKGGAPCYSDLDGAAMAKWVAEQGYTVIHNYDTGRCGLVITACGLNISTNGHVSHRNSLDGGADIYAKAMAHKQAA